MRARPSRLEAGGSNLGCIYLEEGPRKIEQARSAFKEADLLARSTRRKALVAITTWLHVSPHSLRVGLPFWFAPRARAVPLNSGYPLLSQENGQARPAIVSAVTNPASSTWPVTSTIAQILNSAASLIWSVLSFVE